MISVVAGGAGFLGSHLCIRLLSEGHEVVCLDNLSTGRISNVASILSHPRFRFLQLDIIEPLPSPFRVDRIYHLASPASPAAYQKRPVETLRVNSEGTWRLLELASQAGARFLFASTSEVYGDPLEHPQREVYRGNVSTVGPRSMYDEAKRFGEALTVAAERNLNVDVRIARIFNTYGPNMAPNDGRVVSNLIVQALSGFPLTIYGDGSQTRSFQYVDDLVEGLIRLMDSSYRGPINIGNPNELTIRHLAELIKRLTGSQSEIELRPLPNDDPRRRRPDISLAIERLNWSPLVDFEEGLIRTIQGLSQELGSDRCECMDQHLV
jgi:nucleoside-diphosphate-sugar epimerase